MEEKPKGIGIGDTVTSDKLKVRGIVRGFSKCALCKAAEVLIENEATGEQKYYHAESFMA